MSSLLSLSNRQGSHNDRPARDQGDCPSCPVRAVLIVDHFGHFCPLAKRQGSPENRPAASLPRAVDGGCQLPPRPPLSSRRQSPPNGRLAPSLSNRRGPPSGRPAHFSCSRRSPRGVRLARSLRGGRRRCFRGAVAASAQPRFWCRPRGAPTPRALPEPSETGRTTRRLAQPACPEPPRGEAARRAGGAARRPRAGLPPALLRLRGPAPRAPRGVRAEAGLEAVSFPAGEPGLGDQLNRRSNLQLVRQFPAAPEGRPPARGAGGGRRGAGLRREREGPGSPAARTPPPPRPWVCAQASVAR